MTSSSASASTAGAPIRRLALVPMNPLTSMKALNGRSDVAVRRYRLARLRLEDREVARAERFAHLRRTYD
jgi:hypothetical protein